MEDAMEAFGRLHIRFAECLGLHQQQEQTMAKRQLGHTLQRLQLPSPLFQKPLWLVPVLPTHETDARTDLASQCLELLRRLVWMHLANHRIITQMVGTV